MSVGYPIQMNMKGQCCVIVGGGPIALRRAVGLLEVGAQVTVISPHCQPDIVALSAEGKLILKLRDYVGAIDLEQADFVFAATNDNIVNRAVCEDARRLHVQCNHAGESSMSTFTLPAVLRRGRLLMTVSTSGASPGLAKQIRNELSASYGSEYEHYVDFLAEFREAVHTRIENSAYRAMIFNDVLKLDIIELIKSDQLHVLRANLEMMLTPQLRPADWEQQLTHLKNNLVNKGT